MAYNVRELTTAILAEMNKVVYGQDEFKEYLLTAFLSGGHILVEGVPGLAKTLAVKTMAKIIDTDFKRVQFTPDLMPTDITGTKVFDMKNANFYLKKGPLFTNILLADEINRTPPKTQAALLEAMEERSVTIDGESNMLGDVFMVCATQNPVEYEGTYPLPEAQLDRFMMKLLVSYPMQNVENNLLYTLSNNGSIKAMEQIPLNKVCTIDDIRACRAEIAKVTVKPEIINYITTIVTATRKSSNLVLGASPRASITLLMTAKTFAAIQGRDFVMPEDIKALALPVLRHRIIIKPDVEIDGVTPDDCIRNILGRVEVPR